MIRKAFRMHVNPDAHAEYERRHNPIWKELEEVLIAHGVRKYSIFLDPTTSDLFAYAEIESEERWQAIGRAGEHSVLVVAHVVRSREDEEVVRIISVRYALKHERYRYETQTHQGEASGDEADPQEGVAEGKSPRLANRHVGHSAVDG